MGTRGVTNQHPTHSHTHTCTHHTHTRIRTHPKLWALPLTHSKDTASTGPSLPTVKATASKQVAPAQPLLQAGGWGQAQHMLQN